MYHRILVATDGSSGAAAAVERALDFAQRYDAELHVLYVVDTNLVPLDTHAQRVLRYLQEEGEMSVETAVGQSTDSGIETVVGSVREGDPSESILCYVDDNDIDLVVLGTHGRRGVERYLLGSVAERVVRQSPVPVLTVRTAETGENRPPSRMS
ncbi:universal stress protein [Halobium salinum]|uniref:Universal stress protein n=1 Tax=Halobium salinum TaxID=1364940 RepID=A0ABD5PIN0_9EURY|nr:universal stress protein [Halobium salinum]